jgi:hypothetical protein
VNLLGPQGLLILGGAGLAVMILVGALNGWLKWRASQGGESDLDPHSIEATTSYRRFITVAAWSSGSGRNWDSNVRPLLADLLDSAAGPNPASRQDALAAVREALGPELSALCDRNGRCADSGSKGPGRQALRKILEELNGVGRES